MGGGELIPGGLDLEEPLGEPGMEGAALPTGGELGVMPTGEGLPTASLKDQMLSTSDNISDMVKEAEKDLLNSLESEFGKDFTESS